MKWRKILKKSDLGKYYVEISSDMVDNLEWDIGDQLSLEVKEVWMYSRITKKCTIRNLSKESYDRLLDLITNVGPTNTAPNREQ
jgi:hypothetical protein